MRWENDEDAPGFHCLMYHVHAFTLIVMFMYNTLKHIECEYDLKTCIDFSKVSFTTCSSMK